MIQQMRLAALSLFATCAAAQCGFTTMTATTYAQSCNFPSWSVVTAALQPTACNLRIVCSNLFGTTSTQGPAWLAIGSQPIALAQPWLNNCQLLTTGDLYLSPLTPGFGMSVFDFPIPNAPLPPLTLYVQSIAVMLEFPSGYTLRPTDGVKIELM